MPRFPVVFKLGTPILFLFLHGCVNPLPEPGESRLRFAVLNVEQGLSQAWIEKDTALFFDMGEASEFEHWLAGYSSIGKPYIKAIIISHTDLDHKGGLSMLPVDMPFSGMIVTTPYADTAALRLYARFWSSRIFFKVVCLPETLMLLPSISLICLWPPAQGSTDSLLVNSNNRSSFCFKGIAQKSSFLITSDIDTLVEQRLAACNGFGLMSDIAVVPHHGSKYSFSPMFWGFVHPQTAIISCGSQNPFGFPAQELLLFLSCEMMVSLKDTRYDGTIIGYTNGWYWTWPKNNPDYPDNRLLKKRNHD